MCTIIKFTFVYKGNFILVGALKHVLLVSKWLRSLNNRIVQLLSSDGNFSCLMSPRGLVREQPGNELGWEYWIDLNKGKIPMDIEGQKVTFYIDPDKAPPLNIIIDPYAKIDRVDTVDVKVEFYGKEGVGLLTGPDWANEWLGIPLQPDEHHPHDWITIDKDDDGFISKIRLYDISYPKGKRTRSDANGK